MREAVEQDLYKPTTSIDIDAWQLLYSPSNSKEAGAEWRNKQWGSFVNLIPSYTSDLNAMHEAEKVLTRDQVWHYEKLLEDRTGLRWEAIHSTAAHRAEAFLRTLGLWEESK